MWCCVGLDLVKRKCLVAPRIHVEIYAAVVIKNKIAKRVCALDWEGVIIPAIQKPRIIRCDEVASPLVSPQLEMISDVHTGISV